MNRLYNWIKKPVLDTITLYWELLKVMVPIMIVVRLGVEFGLIEHVSLIFTPFMDMVGLPPEAGQHLRRHGHVGCLAARSPDERCANHRSWLHDPDCT
jgi:hypothetical protein